MDKYPNKKTSIYTKLFGLRVEPELKDEITRLRKVVDKDVSESIRIKMRELVSELQELERGRAS